MQTKIEKPIKVSPIIIFNISMKGIKVKLLRATITISGIVLAIAFLQSIFVSSEILKSVETFDSSMRSRQIWLAAMSLIVCGVGITNAMTMSVLERYKEISTMKCLGATDKIIIKIFLLESFLIGSFGSILGAILGTVLTLILYHLKLDQNFLNSNLLINILNSFMISFLIGIIISAISSVYPAYRAAKLLPADAMRTEI